VDDIFNHLDYRAYLRELTARYSHRTLGERGGFDPGLVSKVINGQRNISPKMIPRFATAYGLEGRASRFFELLVLYNQARLPSERKKRLADLLAYGKDRISPITRLQHRYYEHWYHAAIRELLHCNVWSSGNYEELAAMLIPPIQPREAKRTLELLLEMGMVRRTLHGFQLTEAFVTSGTQGQPLGVNTFVQQGIELAQDAMERFDASERNLSGLTISSSEATRQEIIQRIRKFRHEILELVEQDSQPDRVWQLNLQLFPLSKGPTHV